MQSLILTVGLPRSGKSTWSRESGYPMVNPDSIRLALHGKPFLAEAEPEVWHIARTCVLQLFIAGHETVVLDATNLTRHRRSEWCVENWVSKYEWETYYKVFPVAASTCMQRAITGGREYLVPVIERMAEQFESLLPTDKLWVVN